MRHYLKRFDGIIREINACLVAIAIGLAVLDLTVSCLLHAKDLTAILKATITGTVEPDQLTPAGPPIKVIPDTFG